MTREEAKLFVEAFVKLRELATDDMSLQVPNLYPIWKVDTDYAVGDRVLYNNILYKVLISHIAQADWAPDSSPSLFSKVLIPNEHVIPEWEQPGSTNPYMIGDKVIYCGNVYVSISDNNVWAPDIYGWKIMEV